MYFYRRGVNFIFQIYQLIKEIGNFVNKDIVLLVYYYVINVMESYPEQNIFT